MSLNLDKSTWKRVTFGDIAANRNEYYDRARDGVLPYVAGPHIDPGQVLITRYGSTDHDQFPPTFKRMFEPGDVLLHSRGIEKVGVTDRRGVTGEKLFVLRTRDAEVLDQRFLAWLLASENVAAYFRANFSGSVNKFLNWRPVASMEVDLPPLGEQQRLADLLWSVERHAREVSGAVVANQAAADRYFSTALARLSDSTTPVPDLIREMTVGVVVQPTQYYTKDRVSGVPALRGLNVLPGRFDLSELVYFRADSAAELKKSTLREGDVAVVRTGRPGDAAVVTSVEDGFNCIDLIIVRPGPDLDSHFAARFLNSAFGRGLVAQRSAGTAQQHFNVGALKKLSLPTLPIAEQKRLVYTAAQIEVGGIAARAELGSLRVLRLALLDDIFGGDA